jgi:hypothetical protein
MTLIIVVASAVACGLLARSITIRKDPAAVNAYTSYGVIFGIFGVLAALLHKPPIDAP